MRKQPLWKLILSLVVGLSILVGCVQKDMYLPEDGNTFSFEVVPGDNSDTSINISTDQGDLLIGTDVIIWYYDRDAQVEEYLLITNGIGGGITRAEFHLHEKPSE